MTAAIPPATYELYDNDDDVIGTTIAKTYPKGWPIVGNTAGIVAFDEFEVGKFLAWCLTHAADLQRLVTEAARVADSGVCDSDGSFIDAVWAVERDVPWGATATLAPAPVAQGSEHSAHNGSGAGSSPARRTHRLTGAADGSFHCLNCKWSGWADETPTECPGAPAHGRRTEGDA